MAAGTAQLRVEAGPEQGREIAVPAAGIRVGRSSNNDVALADPVMSRFHCRFFYKAGDGLWAEDLGSANQTLLNDQPMRAARLRVGDRLMLGDTLLRVVCDQPPAEPDQPPAAPPAAPAPLFDAAGAAPARPIEFRRRADGKDAQRKPLRAALLTLLLLMAAATAFVWLQRGSFGAGRLPGVADTPPPASAAPALSIQFEKVQASASNVFRYVLTLDAAQLSIQITDLENQRQVPGQQRKPVPSELLTALAESLAHSEFFSLNDSYQGIGTDVWDAYDLTVILGRKAHRVRVVNTLEPDAFKTVRETIEEFGQNELGLAALALAPEKLIEMARAAGLLGRSLYDQREVKHDNLYRAIRALRESEWYLETIEPKPDFYAEAVALRADAERDLQAIHENLLFLAERAIRLQDWADAARQLRILCERIPDRADPRHQAARKKLLDVERRLKTK